MNMRELPIYLLLSLCSTDLSVSLSVTQTPVNLLVMMGESFNLTCSHQDKSYDKIYWYHQPEPQTLTPLGFLSFKLPMDVKNNYMIFGDAEKESVLHVSSVGAEHNGLYLCAVSSYRYTGSQAYFGNGTKLTVLEPGIDVTKPKVKIIKPHGKESCKKHRTLTCVASGFYPDHVSLKWMIGQKEQTKGVATDSQAFRRNASTFEISSRLKIPKKFWNTGRKTFSCIVTFFNGTHYEEFAATEYGIDGKGFDRDDYIQSSQTMKMAYGIFLAKSGLYGFLIVVFVWKRGSVGK